MKKEKRETHALRIGMNLDDRYRIIRVLGEGGFGITYEAENRKIHLRVAIKELFTSYMSREGDGKRVTINRKTREDQELLKHDKEAFLREARILSTFEREPGIVHVLDFFEENGTAYIVMELLDGMTLRDYQMRHGIFEANDIFGRMLPVIKTLTRIHEAGILHRDISPDNVMVMPDGTLKLMDFGAASTGSLEKERTYSEGGPVKDGYAPAEQYIEKALRNTDDENEWQRPEKNLREGPWTDIYALAVTIYTCITGVVPPPALMRSTFDELKRPSELGIHIRPRLENILLKAMSIYPEERFQSCEDFYNSVLATLPQGRKLKKKKQRRIVIPLFIAAAAIFLIFGYNYVRPHEAQVKFHGEAMETISISAPKEMTAKDFFENEEILKERLEVFPGKNNYIWKESNGKITIILPAAALKGQKKDVVAERYLSASWKMEISPKYDLKKYEGAGGSTWAPTNLYLRNGDLSDLTLKQTAQEEKNPDSADAGTTSDIYIGNLSPRLQQEIQNIDSEVALREEDADGNAVLNAEDVLVDSSKKKAEVNLANVPHPLRKLVLYEISHKSMTGDLVYHPEKENAQKNVSAQSSAPIIFSNLETDELPEKAVFETKKVLNGTSGRAKIPEKNMVRLLFTNGKGMSSFIYVVIQRSKDSDSSADGNVRCSFLVDSWSENQMLKEIQKKTVKDHFWDGKISGVREHRYYQVLKKR